MPIIEITREQLLHDSNWGEAFGEVSSGNTNNTVDECPPGAPVDRAPPVRADVAEILAAVNGENDGDSWLGVFCLKDGRYLVVEACCDYTGWD